MEMLELKIINSQVNELNSRTVGKMKEFSEPEDNSDTILAMKENRKTSKQIFSDL